MADQQDETEAQAPSLIDQVRRRRFHVPARFVPMLRAALLGAIVVLALVALVTTMLAKQARREALGLGDTVARLSMARENDRAGAVLFGKAGVVEELAGIAAHLPPNTKLALASRDTNGALTIAIDSADPDALRATLKGDPWFHDFHERAQTMGEEGVIRVTFERAAGAEAAE